MSLRAPEPLGPQHQLDNFDCGKPALSDWLVRHARQAQGSGSAKTFVVSDGHRVAGYFSLTVGQVDSLDAPDRVRKGMGQYPIPVVILADRKSTRLNSSHVRISYAVFCLKKKKLKHS